MERIKNNSDRINFKHYSLFMHLLLYEGQARGFWGEELRIRDVDEYGNYKPVQMWMSIWDRRYGRSHYLYFEEYFVKPLLKLLWHLCDYNLSPEIQRFFRPKEKDPRKKLNHN